VNLLDTFGTAAHDARSIVTKTSTTFQGWRTTIGAMAA
jgi:hypothetical protein